MAFHGEYLFLEVCESDCIKEVLPSVFCFFNRQYTHPKGYLLLALQHGFG